MSVPGCGAGFRGGSFSGSSGGPGRWLGWPDRTVLWCGRSGAGSQDGGGSAPGLGADAVTAEGHAGIGRLRAGLREARVGNGFLEGAVVFFARGSGWARNTAASTAEEATAPSGPCAGG